MKLINWIARHVNEPFDWHLKKWQALLVVIIYLALFALAIWGLHTTGTPSV